MPFVQYMACATATKGHSVNLGIAQVEVESCQAKPLIVTELAAIWVKGELLVPVRWIWVVGWIRVG